MKSWGYGEGYRYPHDESGFSPGETYLPDELVGRRYYKPTRQGFEARIRDRLEALRSAPDEAAAASDGRHEDEP
jgi:putative ATPase